MGASTSVRFFPLWRQTGLDEEAWTNLMLKCGCFQNVTALQVGVETDYTHPKGCGNRRLWIQLGPKQEGYHRSVVCQVHVEEFMPPRNISIVTYKLHLRDALEQVNRADNGSEGGDDGNNESEGKEKENDGVDKDAPNASKDDNSDDNKSNKKGKRIDIHSSQVLVLIWKS